MARPFGMSGARKKWTKAVNKEKREFSPILTPEQAKEIEKSVPKQKLITVNKLAERYKISLTVARKTLEALAADGKIIKVVDSHHLTAYSRPADYVEEVVEVQETVQAKKGGKGKNKK